MFYALCTQHNIDAIELILNTTEKSGISNQIYPTMSHRQREAAHLKTATHNKRKDEYKFYSKYKRTLFLLTVMLKVLM